MTGANVYRVLILLVGILGLSACTEAQFLIAGAKKISQNQEGGYYKVGNPYQIKGVWYYPQVDYAYDQTGIASWYGTQFHGKQTANGEIFDMNAVSAAHKTLPMPSLVRVTNLENGRSLVARLNDRGPFVGNRIIDMSRRAAQLLGFERQGVAKVRVQILADESRQIAAQLQGGQLSADASPIKVDAMPKDTVSSQGLAPPTGAAATDPVIAGGSAAGETRTVVVSGSTDAAQTGNWQPQYQVGQVTQRVVPTTTRLWVQAGSFSQFDNANRARARLSGLGAVDISQVLVDGRDFYRVRVGPVSSTRAADDLLAQVRGAGYTSSRILVD